MNARRLLSFLKRKDHTIIAYFDGSLDKVAAVIDGEERSHILEKVERGAQQIECEAFIFTIEQIPKGSKVDFVTDNQNLVALFNSHEEGLEDHSDHKKILHILEERELNWRVRWVIGKNNPADKLSRK